MEGVFDSSGSLGQCTTFRVAGLSAGGWRGVAGAGVLSAVRTDDPIRVRLVCETCGEGLPNGSASGWVASWWLRRHVASCTGLVA